MKDPLPDSEPDFDMAHAWDRAAAIYQDHRDPTHHTVTYGALAPTEDELQLLGDLRGLRVLDLGCGGGQNAVACALAGATVTGIDSSAAQLAYARHLAEQHALEITWIYADAAQVASLVTPPWDLILAIHTLPYMQEIGPVLSACSRLLARGGRLVISLDHPIRDCFLDETDGDLSGFPIRDYFDTTPVRWQFAEDTPMQAIHLPLSRWFSLLHEASLALTDMLEPPVPAAILDDLWPVDSALAPLRTLPHTLILIATSR